MPDMICPDCQYTGKAAKKKRGSAKLELGAWLLFPFGLPYTLWRMLSKIPVCRQCGSEFLIAADSTIGKKLMAKRTGELPAAAEVKPLPENMPPATASAAAKEKERILPAVYKDPEAW